MLVCLNLLGLLFGNEALKMVELPKLINHPRVLVNSVCFKSLLKKSPVQSGILNLIELI